MQPVILRPDAIDDLRQAQDWYDIQVTGLGADFLREVESVFLQIESLPHAPAVVYRDVRRVAVRRFPYGVFYRVLADRVDIVAIAHNRRSLRVWQDRLE